MKRIISTLALAFALVACGDQDDDKREDQSSQSNDLADSDKTSAETPATPDQAPAGGTTTIPDRTAKLMGDCTTCGPLPDPWARGPLPDPWTGAPDHK
jgi:hypothetical protein